MKAAWLALAVGTVLLGEMVASATELACKPVPDGLGVNIHFTDPKPGEMEMLAQAGFRWVRMDFGWGGTEREKGKYDFSAYDRLLASLDKHHLRAMLILDYSNRHYDGGLSPASDEGRKAFARWAAAAAVHFRGRGVLWEMYNEPNISFWKPKPDVAQYVKLALDVGKALREATPEELYCGPATSEVDFRFLEACFQGGLLDFWCAVSVHPYRQKGPETAMADYARLRTLIDRYAPKGKKIPILSGEWGYSAGWKSFDETRQGRMLPRQWLVNLASEVPLSIWYDWHDDGQDPKEPEHHFGTVHFPFDAARQPVYQPKPAYLAAKTLTSTLAGFSFSKRLDAGSDDDYILLFTNDAGQMRAVAWTVLPEPHPITIPASPGQFRCAWYTGEPLSPVAADSAGLRLLVSDAPQYLLPETANDLWRVAAAWTRPCQMGTHAPGKIAFESTVSNPLARAIQVRVVASEGFGVEPAGSFEVPSGGRNVVRCIRQVFRSDMAPPLKVELDVASLGRLVQTSPVAIDNPLRLVPLAAAGRSLAIRMENPSGDEFRGTLWLSDLEGLAATGKRQVQFAAGETEHMVMFPLDQAPAKRYRFGVWLEEVPGQGRLAAPASRFTAVDDFGRYASPQDLARAYHLLPDGNAHVASEQSLSLALPPEGAPMAGAGCVKISYRFEKGWKFVRLAPGSGVDRAIAGRPRTLGMWVHGDGANNPVTLRVVDATKQVFQPHAERIHWKGWRYVLLSLDASTAGHWGGANDGVIHYPLTLDTLLLIDSAHQQKTEGTIYASLPTLVE